MTCGPGLVSVLMFELFVEFRASQRRRSDVFVNFLTLSNPADAQNVSSLEFCSRDIRPRSYA